MKALIVSDTHGRDTYLRAAIQKELPFDIMIHLGDSEGSESHFAEWVGNDLCFVYSVRGNNDFFSFSPSERIVRIGKYKVLLTHGHQYGVSMSTERLCDEARARGAGIAMFGHSHRPHLSRKGDIIVLNPGSLSFPRQGDRQHTYVVMTLDEDGEARFRLGNVDEKDLAAPGVREEAKEDAL